MKFTIGMRDRDGVEGHMKEVALAAVDLCELPEDEERAVFDEKMRIMKGAISPFIDYGEYVFIEFDTDAGTATVLKVKE